jgi:type I restriction enzyme S subunit
MKSDCYVPSGVPVIRGNNISSTREFEGEMVYITPTFAEGLGNAIVYADDLVFPHRGAIGQVGIVPRNNVERYALSSSLMKLTCDRSQVDPMFLFYFFRSPKGQQELLKNASTVGTPGIGQPLSSLRSINVSIPPLSEQRAVAHILGTLDDKIELNRRMNETLEAIARRLFQSWFVDFDPVRAKAEGRDTGLPKDLADLFPDSFEDSELGEIPKGWDWGTLDKYAFLNPESWTKDTRPPAIQYVDLSNTKWGCIESVTEYSAQDAPSRAQRVLRPSDTIVGTVRPGNGSYAYISEKGLTGSTGFAVLRPKRAEYAELIYLAATSATNIDNLAHLADGGAYPAVRPEVVAATKVACVSYTVVSRFSQRVSPLFQKMSQIHQESRTLAALRDVLLPKLLSGEIRIGACGGV